MADNKTFCSYEGEDFDEDAFTPDGIHRGTDPLHYLTGIVVRTKPDGPGPLGVIYPDADE